MTEKVFRSPVNALHFIFNHKKQRETFESQKNLETAIELDGIRMFENPRTYIRKILFAFYFIRLILIFVVELTNKNVWEKKDVTL